MRTTLRRVELEGQLERTLKELHAMQARVFASRSDFSCLAQPETVDKALLCYVKQLNCESQIFPGDLYDECAEQLKTVQGELQVWKIPHFSAKNPKLFNILKVTRRQVEVLQEKLFVANQFQNQLAESEQQRGELNQKLSQVEQAREELETRQMLDRVDFDLKYRQLMDQNEKMAQEEEEKYHELEAEFENVRAEMEQVKHAKINFVKSSLGLGLQIFQK